MQIGESSEAIKTPEGIYVFTITGKETNDNLKDELYAVNRANLYDETSRTVMGTISRKLLEDANKKIYFGTQE
jgi:hypothetical protein